MTNVSTRRVRVAVLLLGGVGLALTVDSVPAAAQSTWSQRETPAGALARQIRVLATSPKDFTALIGAGKAALALGDSQAAIGFFGRADEVYPASPLPQAGLGAAMVSDGDAYGALQYFAQAQRQGATVAAIGADRGLAYDLLGRHSEAQKDYRAALNGTDGEEARRRLALSLAITGDKPGALAMLAPLMARGDAGAARCRALVLALSGDLDGARRSLESAMPGSSLSMLPFFAKLPTLRSDQKAAAVNLGIFPDSGQPSYAYVPRPSAGPSNYSPRSTAPSSSYASASPTPRKGKNSSIAGAVPMSDDRLASIDELLRSTATPPSVARPVQVASITPVTRSTIPGLATARSRVWVQLASGTNSSALPEQFHRIKTKHRELLEGMSGYVAETTDRSRLLIGPFKTVSDANIIIEDLESVRVDAFSWTSPPGQTIRKLSTE
ncbi:MAG: hypothetical protein ABIO69_02925 [Sphingomicrobium sp.]